MNNQDNDEATTVRAWGSFEVLREGRGYKLKRLLMNPKKHTSVQKHFHRQEVWIVTSGTATVMIDGVQSTLSVGESIKVAIGAWHQIKNDGLLLLEIVEVQQGEYLEEDDIQREPEKGAFIESAG